MFGMASAAYRSWSRVPLVFVMPLMAVAACTTGAPPPSGRAEITPRVSAVATPGAFASPAPPSLPLIVVVEARGKTAHYGVLPGLGDAYDTVAIAGFDGFARARQTFTPRTVPKLPAGGTPLLPPPAVTAADSAYFADGAGVVRRLTPEGIVSQVADFATTAQQELWFAVSPDGKQVEASVLTVPATGSAWSEDLEVADAGGQPRKVRHYDLGTGTPAPTLVVGWDLGGPLATLDTKLSGGVADGGWRLHGSALVHLDDQGSPGQPVGGSNCKPWSSAPDGTVLCIGSPPTVRDPAGNVLWTLPAGSYKLFGGALAPDAGHVATDSILIAADGWADKLAFGFVPEAWVDRGHLVGQIVDPAGKGALDYVNTNDALRGHNLGFVGAVIGGIATPPGIKNTLPSPPPKPSPKPSPTPKPTPSPKPT